MIDNRTTNFNLPLPHAENIQTVDVERLREALTTIDTVVNGRQPQLGFTAENTANKGAANGYCPLVAGKVPSANLPSYVDDVIEVATAMDLPVTGEGGKIYITTTNGFQFRWTGSAYTQLVSSPGSTDAVPEGAINKYFTDTRAFNAIAARLGNSVKVLNGKLVQEAVPYTFVSSSGQSVFVAPGGTKPFSSRVTCELNGVQLVGPGAGDGQDFAITGSALSVNGILYYPQISFSRPLNNGDILKVYTND